MRWQAEQRSGAETELSAAARELHVVLPGPQGNIAGFNGVSLVYDLTGICRAVVMKWREIPRLRRRPNCEEWCHLSVGRRGRKSSSPVVATNPPCGVPTVCISLLFNASPLCIIAHHLLFFLSWQKKTTSQSSLSPVKIMLYQYNSAICWWGLSSTCGSGLARLSLCSTPRIPMLRMLNSRIRDTWVIEA